MTEVIVKGFSKGAPKLCQKGIGVTVLTYRFFLRLTELVLGVADFFLFVLQDLPQQLRLLLEITPSFLRQSKLLLLDRLSSLQLSQLILRRPRLRLDMVQPRLVV